MIDSNHTSRLDIEPQLYIKDVDIEPIKSYNNTLCIEPIKSHNNTLYIEPIKSHNNTLYTVKKEDVEVIFNILFHIIERYQINIFILICFKNCFSCILSSYHTRGKCPSLSCATISYISFFIC